MCIKTRGGGADANYYSSYASSVGVSATATDIFGCAGSLAGNSQECAALNRHVAQRPVAQQSDPSQFYLAAPANYYARFWPQNAINNMAYGSPATTTPGSPQTSRLPTRSTS